MIWRFRGWPMAVLFVALAVLPAQRGSAQPSSKGPPAGPSERGERPGAKMAKANQPARQQAPRGVHRPTVLRGIPQPRKPTDPFNLTPDDQATVELVLRVWEQKQRNIKTFSCEFTLWEYDGTYKNGVKPKSASDGHLYYASPDKGKYEVFDADGNHLEHWVCDGKAIYQFDSASKVLKEHRLPEEMRGKAIADSPLPFVFGSTAHKMMERYWLRVTTVATPGNENFLKKGEIMLEAIPKFRQDAANFQKVEVILNEGDMLPYAINQFLPSHSTKNPNRKAYAFRDHAVNGFLDQVNRVFSRPRKPIGWKHVVENPGEEPPEEKVELPIFDRGALRAPANKVKK